MKCFILTRRKLIMAGFSVGILALAIMVAINTTVTAVTTATAPRIIPIYCVDKGEEKVCSISFDAAWGNEQTNSLLDTLDEYNVKATFFLVGDWVEKYPDDVVETAKRGHDIGNHSDSHPHMSQLSKDELNKELQECNSKIEKLINKKVTLFRPPYGDYNNAVVEATKENDMFCVQWDIDSLDWKDPSPDEMVRKIKQKLKPGSIILMHNGAKNTPEALPKILKMIQEEGYTLVPISELIPQGDYYTDHEGRMFLSETESDSSKPSTTIKVE